MQSLVPMIEPILKSGVDIGTHAFFGARGAKIRNEDQVLGALAAILLSRVANTPFANSIVGSGVVAAGYAKLALDQLSEDPLNVFGTVPEGEKIFTTVDDCISRGGSVVGTPDSLGYCICNIPQ